MNTEWAIGLAVYAGTDSKIVRNSKGTPSKSSSLERLTSELVVLCVLGLAISCTLSTLFGVYYDVKDTPWYLGSPGSKENVYVQAVLNFFTFFLLFSQVRRERDGESVRACMRVSERFSVCVVCVCEHTERESFA